jgi:hypothetical protein
MIFNKDIVVDHVLNKFSVIPLDTGMIQIQEMGVVKSVENVDFYVNVFVKTSNVRVKISQVANAINLHINALTKQLFKTTTITYIRNYTIFCDDGVKEIVTKRTVTYKPNR